MHGEAIYKRDSFPCLQIQYNNQVPVSIRTADKVGSCMSKFQVRRVPANIRKMYLMVYPILTRYKINCSVTVDGQPLYTDNIAVYVYPGSTVHTYVAGHKALRVSVVCNSGRRPEERNS